MIYELQFVSVQFAKKNAVSQHLKLDGFSMRPGPLPSEMAAPEISETGPKDTVAVGPADEVEDDSSRQRFLDTVWKLTLTGCAVVFIHCISMVKMKDAANRKMASFACLQSSPLGAIFWTKNVCSKVICQALVFAASALFLLTGFKLTRLV